MNKKEYLNPEIRLFHIDLSSGIIETSTLDSGGDDGGDGVGEAKKRFTSFGEDDFSFDSSSNSNND